jgi:simple sugar transport system permease protein
MSEPPEQLPPSPDTPAPTTSSALAAFYERAGGFLIPVVATLVAFLIGGLVVLITGHNPLSAYRAIFEGTGFNYLFPWISEEERRGAARDLQQTLLLAAPLMLTALAVAFAFRCGLFNIGGQGQYWVGFIAALWVGTHVHGLPRLLHIALAIAAAIVAGGIWGGIAGFLRATVGAHEVITTIMLNWIAIYGGVYLFERGGPLQGVPSSSLPQSAVVDDSAKLWPIWGDIQALHSGIFIALAAVGVYYILLSRTTLGFEVRAVGFNPEAARYAGIPVARSYFLALAIAGAFAGLAGAIDVLGFQFSVETSEISASTVGFTGIAVALLGRNKPIGIILASLLFAALQVGTSSRQLDPSIFDPELASDLSTMIQALVIFFVAAELLIVSIWNARRYFQRRPRPAEEAA